MSSVSSGSPVYERLCRDSAEQGGALWQLLDPDKLTPEQAAVIVATAERMGCDAFLVGASEGSPEHFAAVARSIKRTAGKPVLIFPNGAAQVVPHADAILFMSLLSGRNPEYLVGEQVKGAPLVESYGLEAIATGYLLIESGRTSAVEFVSNTRPIPRDQVGVARAHALAAKYFGMKLVYLEAGSGAPQSVPLEMVRACAGTGTSLAVGGGLREPSAVAACVAAGAHFVVVGTRFEPEPDWNLFKEFADAAHAKKPVAT
jgi:putative glycerol-1-phosphate prenyltransferase